MLVLDVKGGHFPKSWLTTLSSKWILGVGSSTYVSDCRTLPGLTNLQSALWTPTVGGPVYGQRNFATNLCVVWTAADAASLCGQSAQE
jgi:hypothetical protein